ncbi:MAG: S24/S26 family peptidase [Butyribacter sp.]|nr:S24/S26 family peptidase [Butyribacter sp.]
MMKEKKDSDTRGIRAVDNREYLGMLCELLKEGRSVKLMVAGNSMAPFLAHGRDEVMLSPVEGELKKGDIVLYQRDNGEYILHRIRKIKDRKYEIIGDGQRRGECFVRRDQIIARAVWVLRKGIKTEPGDFWWDFFEGFWLKIIPLRGILRRLYPRWLMERKQKKAI